MAMNCDDEDDSGVQRLLTSLSRVTMTGGTSCRHLPADNDDDDDDDDDDEDDDEEDDEEDDGSDDQDQDYDQHYDEDDVQYDQNAMI